MLWAILLIAGAIKTMQPVKYTVLSNCTTIQNRIFRFTTSDAINTLLSISVALFYFSSLKIIYDHSIIKMAFDISRLCILFIIIILTNRSMLLVNKYMILYLAASFVTLLFNYNNSFFYHTFLSAVLVLSLHVNNIKLDDILGKSLHTSLYIIVMILLFVKAGIIDGSVGYNPLGEISQIVVSYKYDWGFWQFNTISNIVTGCIVASYYVGRIKLLSFFLLLYVFILTETVSRTFVVIPVIILWSIIISTSNVRSRFLIYLPYLLICILSLVMSACFVFPGLFEKVIGSVNYNLIDVILSYRLSLSALNQENLGGWGYILGKIGDKKLLDSFYINLFTSNGMIVLFPYYLLLITTLFKAVINRMHKEIVVISCFLLISNFESSTNASSLFFLCFLYSVLAVISRKQSNLTLVLAK